MIEILRFLLEGIVIPLLAVMGVVVNVTSLFVLKSHALDMKLAFRNILMMLALFDGCFVVLCTFGFSFPVLFVGWKQEVHPYLFPNLLPWIQISLSGSIWTVVAVGLERYQCVAGFTSCNASFVQQSSGILYIMPV
ncbi:uncharacterized protein LOC111697741 [Eurytemora carolleeae]|uniref:uncharacterized protein LOC111697741 n=1 Tax=Eurytemora carolleeae TaxID=1294199 RepID=UPI000C77F08E|nr:uncharacterized protein LOC111697741 [Eurytemora carolleeae]|eukprot:XP_023323614.1 uncharacterized protein LOC111697741 [Eurytemora affinis]